MSISFVVLYAKTKAIYILMKSQQSHDSET